MTDTEAQPVRIGNVYEGPYGVRYQVLAIWDEYAWVHVSGSGGINPPTFREPRTEPLDFLHQDGMRLLWELPA